MTPKILVVDDDFATLAAHQKVLDPLFHVELARGSDATLARLREEGPYAVVLAPTQLEPRGGIDFLVRARELAPDVVRVLLAQTTEQRSAITTVNEGHAFRFLLAPYSAEELSAAVAEASNHFHVAKAERAALENTVNGSIKVLTDILAMVEPQIVGRSQKLRSYISGLARSLKLHQVWELEAAALLSQVGCMSIPPVVAGKAKANLGLTGPEKDMIARIPETSSRLIANIPRLEGVARIVLYQHKNFDGSGFPPDSVAGEDIPQGARMLKVLADLLAFEERGLPRFRALRQMRQTKGIYDPTMVDAAISCFDLNLHRNLDHLPKKLIPLAELRVGQIVADNVETSDGLVLLAAGTPISQMILEKLQNFSAISGIKEPLLVVG